MSDPTKKQLRRSMRKRRIALSARQVSHASRAVVGHLLKMPALRNGRHIGVYYPHLNEINPLALTRHPSMRHKRFYLPAVMLLHFEPLRFAPLHHDMKLNRFGIPEPDIPVKRMHKARMLDVLLVPLVAFDSDGHRLGFGAGFYDRTLAYLTHRHHLRKPRLIGLAYEFQQVERLPADPWDITLPEVVTEQGVVTTAAGQLNVGE